MFAVDEFISECRAALGETEPGPAIREILARAVSTPGVVADAFEPPTRAELTPLYASPELTILKVIWAPGMQIPPHDHLMWATIGIYGGEERNQFFRRSPEGLVASGGKSLAERDTVILGQAAIHSVANPNPRVFTGSIHIYGGDYLNKPRSQWNPDSMQEEPSTGERIRELFEAANKDLPEIS
jgi:predicted metal-dependent enzyme (double-stranded beta helix superfamily)